MLDPSFPTLGTWIEINGMGIDVDALLSFPTLGMWIEIDLIRILT